MRRRSPTMLRPARVRIRRRKPCTLERRRLFGWKVRLPLAMMAPHVKSAPLVRPIEILMSSPAPRWAATRRAAHLTGARQTVQDYAHEAAPTKLCDPALPTGTTAQATTDTPDGRCLTSALQLILRVAQEFTVLLRSSIIEPHQGHTMKIRTIHSITITSRNRNRHPRDRSTFHSCGQVCGYRSTSGAEPVDRVWRATPPAPVSTEHHFPQTRGDRASCLLNSNTCGVRSSTN